MTKVSTTRALVNSKSGSLVKFDPRFSKKVMLPEESVLLGYGIRRLDGKSPSFKVSCYKIRNGIARLVAAYTGRNCSFFTNELEQAPINWACASSVMPDGEYHSLANNGSLISRSRGGMVHVATQPQKNLTKISQELHRSFNKHSSPLEIYGLDHSGVDSVDDMCEKVNLKIGKVKSCLFHRFLVGLYGPAPELSNQFRNVVNSLSDSTNNDIKPLLVSLYDKVESYIEASKKSIIGNENKDTLIVKPIIRSSNFNFSRQRDKLLKIINFLSIIVGMKDDESIELHKVPSTKDRVPLINIVECGSPVCVNRTDIDENFMFPSTWISSPYENIHSDNEVL